MSRPHRVLWLLVVVAISAENVAAEGPGVETKQAPPAQAKACVDLLGDPLPPGALARMGTVRFAQGDSMHAYPVLAPDHKTFVTVSNHTPHHIGRVVCIWDADTGKELRHVHDEDFEYYQAFFLKTENVLATIGNSRKPIRGKTYAYVMHFWDLKTGKRIPSQIQNEEYHFEPWAVSADEKWLASAGRNTPVLVRNLKTGEQLAMWDGAGKRVGALAFSPDGKTLLIGFEKSTYFWNWKENREIHRMDQGELFGLSFSPDGKWLAGLVHKEGVRLWETAKFTEVLRFKDPLPQTSLGLRFFPDSKKLLSTLTGVIWEVPSGKELGRLENCQNCLTLEFSRDGKTATGYARGRIRRWDTDTGKDRSPPSPPASQVIIHQVGFLPDGKTVAFASADGGVGLWDTASGREPRMLVKGTVWDHRHVNFLRVGPDGTIVVVQKKRLMFFKNDKALEEIELDTFPAENLLSVNVSPDGKHLLLAGGSAGKSVVQLWDLSKRKPVASFSPSEQACLESLGVLSGGQQMAACIGDSLCLLNARTGAIERTLVKRPEPPPMKERGFFASGYGYFHGIHALNFSPAGDLLASTGHPSGGLTLVDVLSAKIRQVLVPPLPDRGHYQLRNAVFSPDGRMLAADSESEVVDVWETASGQRRRRFLGHRSYQTTLAFSPDGRRLATGNRDATVLIWDVFGVSTNASSLKPVTGAELEILWTGLMNDDAERACLAMGQMMGCPDVSVPFLKKKLLDSKSLLPGQLKRWIAELDSKSFEKRETASKELAKQLPAAEPILKESLTGARTLEMKRRIEQLLGSLEYQPPSGQLVRDLRGLEVLEQIGSKDFREIVHTLAEGDYHPRLSAAAKSTRKRLTAKAP